MPIEQTHSAELNHFIKGNAPIAHHVACYDAKKICLRATQKTPFSFKSPCNIKQQWFFCTTSGTLFEPTRYGTNEFLCC